jgi:hypothetical protein
MPVCKAVTNNDYFPTIKLNFVVGFLPQMFNVENLVAIIFADYAWYSISKVFIHLQLKQFSYTKAESFGQSNAVEPIGSLKNMILLFGNIN